MDRYVVTILPGGRITIPAAIRRGLGLEPGDILTWWEQEGGIVLRKVEPSETSPFGNRTVAEVADLYDGNHDMQED